MVNCTESDDSVLCVRFEASSHYLKHYQLVSCASIVILMQLGFTFLEVGSVRIKFTKGILMKNMIDLILSALSYFVLGFALAFGDGTSTGGFVGVTNFFVISKDNDTDIDHSYAGWIYHWSYCATAATIVAGAIAERTQLAAYCIYSVLGSTCLYPVITHWIWSKTGWASDVNDNSLIEGVLDKAGGIAVHTCAGMCSLVACVFVGPRHHRLNKKGNFVNDLPKQNQSFIVFGMFVLWFSWYAFNAGPAVLSADSDPMLMGRIAAYTTVCAASSGTTYLLLYIFFSKSRKLPEPSDLSNGIIAGLVCSTSGCSVILPHHGILLGAVAGCIVVGASKLMRYLKIDDVVDAVAVHLGCGVWSAVSAPFFAETVLKSNVSGEVRYSSCGIITGCEHGWAVLGSNVLLVFLTIVWVTLVIAPACFLLRQCRILRIAVESEKLGVDMVEFEGLAYNSQMNGTREVDSSSLVLREL